MAGCWFGLGLSCTYLGCDTEVLRRLPTYEGVGRITWGDGNGEGGGGTVWAGGRERVLAVLVCERGMDGWMVWLFGESVFGWTAWWVGWSVGSYVSADLVVLYWEVLGWVVGGKGKKPGRVGGKEQSCM